jgi:hypothetical protein
MKVAEARFILAPPQGASPLLSWMLTEQEKENIQAAWQDVLEGKAPGDPLGTVASLFG